MTPKSPGLPGRPAPAGSAGLTATAGGNAGISAPAMVAAMCGRGQRQISPRQEKNRREDNERGPEITAGAGDPVHMYKISSRPKSKSRGKKGISYFFNLYPYPPFY